MDGKRFFLDLATWAICIVAIAILSKVGVIENPGFALAGGALWLAIRKRGEA